MSFSSRENQPSSEPPLPFPCGVPGDGPAVLPTVALGRWGITQSRTWPLACSQHPAKVEQPGAGAWHQPKPLLRWLALADKGQAFIP